MPLKLNKKIVLSSSEIRALSSAMKHIPLFVLDVGIYLIHRSWFFLFMWFSKFDFVIFLGKFFGFRSYRSIWKPPHFLNKFENLGQESLWFWDWLRGFKKFIFRIGWATRIMTSTWFAGWTIINFFWDFFWDEFYTTLIIMVSLLKIS